LARNLLDAPGAAALIIASLSFAGRLDAQLAEESPVQAYDLGESDAPEPFDWDLVSLEQATPRYNASVLSGFHSVRSPGVTPRRAWKTGLGLLYSREEQVLESTNTEFFRREQLILNPKINYGLFTDFEAGAGFEASWTKGREPVTLSDGSMGTESEESFEASAAALGVKWGFLRLEKLRLGLAFDSRIAVNQEAFGALPGTIYNVELDGDYRVGERLSAVTNIQYLTNNHWFEEDLFVFDGGLVYTFSDEFRGMLFGTLVQDDEADNVLIFAGIAGQYVFEQHSFTLAFDLQINEADRDVRTQKQIDVEFSYTFTF
jgi:hypothetical protein